jgi:superkiller protein 3
LHFELAKALEKNQHWDEAIGAYQRAIDLNPNYSLAHHHLGNALAERGQIYEASISYRRVLQLQAATC